MAGTVGSQIVKVQTAIAGGDTVGNSAAATVFATVWAMPANFLAVGRALQIRAHGVYSTLVAVAGNLTLDLIAGATILATTGAQALTVNLTNLGWELTADVVCITTGAGGTVEAQGKAILETTGLTTNVEMMPNVATVALDTTAIKNIGVQVTFSVANAANTITQRLLLVSVGGVQ
jgi:hypothetical protein